MEEEPLKFKPGLLSYKGLNLIRNVHKESYLDSLQEIEIQDTFLSLPIQSQVNLYFYLLS